MNEQPTGYIITDHLLDEESITKMEQELNEYSAEAVREQGRQAALREKQDRREHPEEWLALDDPEYALAMQEDAETRDRCRVLANQGNMAARKQADYLDGYLAELNL